LALGIVAVLCAALGPPASAEISVGRVSGGQIPVDWTDAEKEEFLRTAEVVERETLPTGVTLSSRATLSNGRFTHDAHIQTFNVHRKKAKVGGRTFLDFYDSYRFNIAAYRLDRRLGLNMVPVSVERRIQGKPAAVTWWVDDVLMSLRERYSKRTPIPDIALWNDQRYQARAFNQLIYNSDPHLGNHLIDKNWKLWMIDFTRAFRTFRKLPDVKVLDTVDRRFYDGLQRLTEESLKEATAPHLGGRERKAILVRRDLLLEHLDTRIAEEGEDAVICTLPGH
jgi:hypothetical protein